MPPHAAPTARGCRTPRTYWRWSAARASRRLLLTGLRLRVSDAWSCGYVPLALYSPTTNRGVGVGTTRSGFARVCFDRANRVLEVECEVQPTPTSRNTSIAEADQERAFPIATCLIVDSYDPRWWECYPFNLYPR